MQGIENVNLITAFTGGLLSFFSPCVLPLIPVYLSFVSGMTFEQMTDESTRGKTFAKVFFNTFMFVIGFSTVFVLLGLGASSIGQFLKTFQREVSLGAGIVIVFLALHFMGLLRIKWLYYEKRVNIKKRRFGPLSSFLLGFAFAFGWTPCIGPILASILLIASQQEGTSAGMLLLAVYSAGLAIPFLATAVFLNTFLGFFKKVNRHFETIEIAIGGVLLIAATWLIFTQFEYIVSSKIPMLIVAGIMLILVVLHKKLPKAIFASATGLLSAALVIGGLALFFTTTPPTKAIAGDEQGPIPVEFNYFDGTSFDLSQYKGQPVLLNFFASWCTPCKKEIPELIAIHNELPDKGFAIVGVNCDDEAADGKNFTDGLNIPYEVVHGKVDDLKILGERTALPTNIILDGNGRKVKGFTGFPGRDIVIKQINELKGK